MWLTIPFLVFVGLVLPMLAAASRRAARRDDLVLDELPSATAMAVQTLVIQGVLLLLAWVAAWAAGIDLVWSADLRAHLVLAAAGLVAAALVLARLEARTRSGPADALHQRLRLAGLTPPWLAVAGAAAVAEEVAYRWVLVALLKTALPTVAAITVSALLFAVAHFTQGWRGAAGSFVAAWCFHGLVIAARGLGLAIAVHLLYDLGAAWMGKRLADARADAPPNAASDPATAAR